MSLVVVKALIEILGLLVLGVWNLLLSVGFFLVFVFLIFFDGTCVCLCVSVCLSMLFFLAMFCISYKTR